MRAYRARVDAVLVQAVIAAALSFAHLHDIATSAGQNGWKAWAYPISVDLLLVAAWRRLRSGPSKAAGWCWFVFALAASLGANVATAGLLDLGAVPAWLRILVAGWPAVAFLGGTLLAHSTTPPRPVQPSVDAVELDLVDEDEAPDQAELGGSAPPPALPEPTDQRTTPPVPTALVEHARKLATAHQQRTGRAIDTPTLRAQLGVPAPLAEAIAAQL